MKRARRPPMRRAARAGDLLGGLLAGWGLDERMHQYQALLIWDEVVGPQIAARTKPEKIRDGVLEVCVDQPTWMQQLQLLKPQILAKLNAQLGSDNALREIFLKRGKVTARTTAASRAPVPAWRRMTLSPGEETELRTLLEGVADGDLRRDLGSLLAKQLKLTKAKKQSSATDKIG
jgi:hypothetical protein